jgi:hypothetical protein
MKYITIEDIQKAVEQVRRFGIDEQDQELAHIEEDALYAEVLRNIVGGHPDPAGIAAAALKAKEIDYGRWYA